MRRLARRVRIGGYLIDVALVSKSMLNDILGDEEHEDEEHEGGWVGEAESRRAGVIYLDQNLTVEQQRETFFHELQHAVNDLARWDRRPNTRRAVVSRGKKTRRP
jgi:hypothetical protein